MRLFILGLAAAAVFLLGGCGSGKPASALPGGSSPAGAHEALIGADLELSGIEAAFGQATRRGMDLALDEVNARPDQIKLRVIYEDNKSEVSQSRNAIKKLIAQDGVVAVIGAVASSRTLAASDVAMEEKVPLMTHASTHVAITKKGEYVSRTCFNDEFQGAVMAKFARTRLKAQKAVIMFAQGNPYSEGLANTFKRVFTENGGTVEAELAFQEGTVDFKTHVTILKQRNPDIVWLPAYFNEAGLIIRQARDAGFRAPFLGTDGWDNPELFKLAGVAIKDNYLCNHFSPNDPNNPLAADFVKRFKARYGIAPGAMAALGYDAVLAMADSINRAKDLKPESIKDAINSIKDLRGVCGTLTMNSEREVAKDALILETGSDDFVYKETFKP